MEVNGIAPEELVGIQKRAIFEIYSRWCGVARSPALRWAHPPEDLAALVLGRTGGEDHEPGLESPVEAIILAETRLAASRLARRPEAHVGNRGPPFLEHLVRHLARRDRRIVLSVFYSTRSSGAISVPAFWVSPSYTRGRRTPWTGGAIYRGLLSVEGADALVLNATRSSGSTRATCSPPPGKGWDVTIGIKFMEHRGRYGACGSKGQDRGLSEKQTAEAGYINGGVYGYEGSPRAGAVSRAFSFETDLLQDRAEQLKLCPFVGDGYFIDIGTPEDYRRARRELPNSSKGKHDRYAALTESPSSRRDRLPLIASSTGQGPRGGHRQVLLHHVPGASPLLEHRHRIVYSKVETVKTVDEIVHPSVRETVKHLNLDVASRSTTTATSPRARDGSSSAFTVCLLKALYA